MAKIHYNNKMAVRVDVVIIKKHHASLVPAHSADLFPVPAPANLIALNVRDRKINFNFYVKHRINQIIQRNAVVQKNL